MHVQENSYMALHDALNKSIQYGELKFIEIYMHQPFARLTNQEWYSAAIYIYTLNSMQLYSRSSTKIHIPTIKCT
jgi:hypothetical protein